MTYVVDAMCFNEKVIEGPQLTDVDLDRILDIVNREIDIFCFNFYIQLLIAVAAIHYC